MNSQKQKATFLDSFTRISKNNSNKSTVVTHTINTTVSYYSTAEIII